MKDKQILIVDDSPAIRKIIGETLISIGFKNCYKAENGKKGLEILGKNEISLIITDWNMPVMNGLEFVTAIRGSDSYKGIPILMVTTRGMKEDVLEAVHAGVNNYIVKPFTPETLEKKVQELLS